MGNKGQQTKAICDLKLKLVWVLFIQQESFLEEIVSFGFRKQGQPLKLSLYFVLLQKTFRTLPSPPSSAFQSLFLRTLRSIILATLRVFSTKTQYFTPMFRKSGVEVQFFLKGSKLSRDKNSETPNFKHFRPESSMGKLLKVLQNIFSNKLVSGKKW